MKKIRLILSALLIMLCANMAANAATIGYADFEKVLSDYSYARTAFKDLDNKITELQQYAIDKDKQYKALESPIQRKTFEDQIQREFQTKEERLYNLKTQKEKVIRDNILAACKSVAAAKKLDAIVDGGVIYAGGIDVTNDIIQYLNSQPQK